MRVCVTGATGFLGSHLVHELVERGHDVAILLRSTTDAWRLTAVMSRVTPITGALDDIDGFRGVVADFAPAALIHMAWRGVGNDDRNNPSQARNIVDTVELLKLCSDIGIKVFVGAGSQAEYGPYERAIREDDFPRPTTLYGKAKLAAGTMAAQMAEELHLRFVWLRVFSAYGAKDHSRWLIPSLIKTLKAGKRMPLTRCEQLWSFVHARDVAAAFRVALENEHAVGNYNLGSPEATPLNEVVTLVRDLVNPAAELGFGDIPYRQDQVMILQPDIRRMLALGWKPSVALPVGLRETVQWYVNAARE